MRVAATIFLLNCSLLGIAQLTIRAKQITTNDGLSQNSVNVIAEDAQGYIWLGTQDGLNRYNGRDFKVFRPDLADSFAIQDNYISQISIDTRDRVWVLNRAGIEVFHRETGRFHRLVSRNREISFAQFASFYIVDDTLFLRDYAEPSGIWKLSINFDFGVSASHYIEDVGEAIIRPLYPFWYFFDDDYQLVASHDSIHYLQRCWDKPLNYFPQGGIEFHQTLKVRKDAYLIPEFNNLLLAHFDEGKMEIVANERTYSFAAFQDRFFVGTSTGIGILDLEQRKLEKVTVEGVDLSQTIIHTIFKDSFGQYWFGTANQGLFIFDPKKSHFEYVTLADGRSNFVWKVDGTRDKLLFGTDNGLVECVEDQPRRYLQGEKVTLVLEDNQSNHWVGTYKGEILRKRPTDQEYSSLGQVSPLAITNAIERGDSIIFGSQSGSYVFKDGHFFEVPWDQTFATYVLAMFEDSQRNIWIGHAGGCSMYTPQGERHSLSFVPGDAKSPSFNFISGFAEERDGTMWISTYGGGLNRINPDSTISVFDESHGLSNNVLHGLQMDDEGMLWMMSNGGVSMFDPNSHSFVNFNNSHGIISHNFPIAGIYKDDEGQILIGSDEGLLRFHPDKAHAFAIPPVVVWEKLELNYRSVGMKYGDINALEALKIDYTDQVFNLEVGALKFDAPEEVRFSYQLQGFSEQWVALPATERRITYSSLPYDNYSLIVKAESINNHFSPVERTLLITVDPPFWLAWWFVAGEVLVTLVTVGGLVYYLSRRKLRQRIRELETREKVQQERERISRDLHDSVGTHFAYIVSRLDFLYLGWDKGHVTDKKDYLQKLGDFARSGMRLLRETIWALNQEEVKAINLKAKIDDYLRLCFTNQQTGYRFQFDCETETLHASVALNCFRIIQETVSNSLKHAEARKVDVIMAITDKAVSLTVQDDGKGFDVAEGQAKANHFGLENLEKRAKELNGELIVHSGHDGTMVTIAAPNTA